MIILPRPCKAKTMKIALLGKLNENFKKSQLFFAIKNPNFSFIKTIIVIQL
jgi:hypothetical protein